MFIKVSARNPNDPNWVELILSGAKHFQRPTPQEDGPRQWWDLKNLPDSNDADPNRSKFDEKLCFSTKTSKKTDVFIDLLCFAWFLGFSAKLHHIFQSEGFL